MGAFFDLQRWNLGAFFVGVSDQSQESTSSFRSNSRCFGDWLDEFIDDFDPKWNVSNLYQSASYQYDHRDGNADDFLGGVWVELEEEKRKGFLR